MQRTLQHLLLVTLVVMARAYNGYISSETLEELYVAEPQSLPVATQSTLLAGGDICATATSILAKCPINAKFSARHAAALTNPRTVRTCCAAAKSFNDGACGKSNTTALLRLQTALGSTMPCGVLSNAWGSIGRLCGFESTISFCPVSNENDTSPVPNGRHLLQQGACNADNTCGNNECCSRHGYCGCGDAYCGSDCRGSCGGCKSSCFPASASVQTPSGPKRMDELKIGDKVEVATPDGMRQYEDIFFVSHRRSNTRRVYVGLTTSSAKVLHASPDHLVHVVTAKAGQRKLVDMASVQVGDQLWTSAGQDNMAWEKVVKVETMLLDGLYHPHTASGTILVNGISASCYTKHIQVLSTTFGNMLFAPFKVMYKLLGADKMSHVNEWILGMGIADSESMVKIISGLHLIKYGTAGWASTAPYCTQSKAAKQ